MHLAYSHDGINWSPLNGGRSVITPAVTGSGIGWQEWNTTGALMRDPSILRGPDGMFHLVWTVAWTDHAHRRRTLARPDPLDRADARAGDGARAERAQHLGAGPLLRRREEAVRDRLGDRRFRGAFRRPIRSRSARRAGAPITGSTTSTTKDFVTYSKPRSSTTAASARSTARSRSAATPTTS